MTKTAKKKAESKARFDALQAKLSAPRELFKSSRLKKGEKPEQRAVDAIEARIKARTKRPSIVAQDTIRREGLTNSSSRFRLEAAIYADKRMTWMVTLDSFFVAEFESITAAKKVYPNAKTLGGQSCAEGVFERDQPVPEEVKPKPMAKANKARARAKAKAIEWPCVHGHTMCSTRNFGPCSDEAASRRESRAKQQAAPESAEDRKARQKEAARKAWETRRANGWKHPKAKPASEFIQKVDAQLAQSKANAKQARATLKAIDAKKAERKKAEAMLKRVEKREREKRQVNRGLRNLQNLMTQALG
jgi:hypothetical protein